MVEGALVLEDLSLNFGGLSVLNELRLETRPGEILALIGPNGAGKTSVLNCISGIYRPGGGRIVFEGSDITGLKPHIVARRG
ncbi:MAG: ATP-binding cassette domain-containing protein, partial [Alphaproteobacteria bacterium]|nr:ATP-binding cassette domain-containing protein [Alphaproteobacteria bacterium]